MKSQLIRLAILLILPGCALIAPEYDLSHTPSSQDYSSLNKALDYADKVSAKMNSLDIEIGVIRTTSNFALLGAALSAASVAAFTSSRDAIVGLGLGSAGILGYQYETAISSRQTIFDNARAAIACAEQSALIMSEQNPGTATSLVSAVGPGVAAAVPAAAAAAPAAAALAPSTSASAQSLNTLVCRLESNFAIG